MWDELASGLQHGNPYLIAILFLGFLATVIVIERLIMLQFYYNINFRNFINELRKAIVAQDLQRAARMCKNYAYTSLPRISLRAIEAAETDPTTVRGTIEEETMDFLPKVEARLGAIPAFATAMMFLGILGTISALWAAFHSVDILDTTKKQASLAQSIALALNPTALGVLLCMVFIACHQFLKGSALKTLERVQLGVTVLTNLLVPKEVATYMPMAAGAPMGEFASPAAAAEPSHAAGESETKGVSVDDVFSDASVDNIKDEEEII